METNADKLRADAEVETAKHDLKHAKLCWSRSGGPCTCPAPWEGIEEREGQLFMRKGPIGMGLASKTVPTHGDTGLYWKLTPSQILAEANRLKAKRSLMVEYLRLKLDEDDMHGVQDAASDIRDIDAEVKGLEWAIGERK